MAKKASRPQLWWLGLCSLDRPLSLLYSSLTSPIILSFLPQALCMSYFAYFA